MKRAAVFLSTLGCVALPWLAGRAGAACVDAQELESFQQAAYRELSCELADRLLGEEGCGGVPVPECGRAALEELALLLPGGFGDRLLARWGYRGAQCRLALARGAELSLHELLSEPLSPEPPSAEPSPAQQTLAELSETCEGVEVGLRGLIGGSCSALAEWGDIIDGSRLRGCLTHALGKIADDVKPGSSERLRGHSGGRPGHGRRGRSQHGGRPEGHP